MVVFNWNHFEMSLLNLRINFYLLRTFCHHLGSLLGQKRIAIRQQLLKAVITGDTVTRLSLSIRGRGKSPEEGQR